METIFEGDDARPTDGRTTYPNTYTAVVPNGKVCAVTGLKHGYLYLQLTRGEASKHVRTVSLREPGKNRGKFLFHTGDMLRWLDRLAAEQARAKPRSPLQGA